MFNLTAVKRQTGKRSMPESGDIYQFKHFERPLIFYSTIPTKRWNDEIFLSLTRYERGDFCLLVDFLWNGCGSISISDTPNIAKVIDIPESELIALIKRLIEVGLLEEHDGRYIQPSLRQQYLSTSQANYSKRHKKAKDDNTEQE